MLLIYFYTDNFFSIFLELYPVGLEPTPIEVGYNIKNVCSLLRVFSYYFFIKFNKKIT